MSSYKDVKLLQTQDGMIIVYEWHNFVVSCPREHTIVYTSHHHYHCTRCLLTMQRTESQAECLSESHGTLQTERPFFSLPLSQI